MKKLSKLIAAVALFFMAVPSVDAFEPYIFNHLGVSVNAGTLGISAELSTPITKFITLRAGATFMPNFSFSTDFDGEYTPEVSGDYTSIKYFNMDVDASLKRTQGNIIFNIYPFAHHSSFFLAAGAYFGGESIIGIHGHSDELMNLAHNNPFIEIGDYQLPVDQNGNVDGSLRSTKKFRPYLGFGFGRPLPKGRLNFGFELGVQFMGKTAIYNGDTELHPSDYLDNDDDWQKWMDKITVYPVLKFTLSGRIF